jgi:hypothetical protein
MALPTVVGTGARSETSAVWPAGHLAGDWGYLAVEHGSGTVTTPTGWTPRYKIANGATSTLTIFRKKAASGAEAAAALAGGTDHMWGGIIAFRGCDATEPEHAVATMIQQGGAITTGTLPGVLTDEDNCLLAMWLAWNIDNAGPLASAETNATLGSVTEQSDDGTVTNNGGGFVSLTGTLAAHGYSDITQLTLATASQWTAITIALRPAQPAAAFTFAGTAVINGVAAPNGATVYILDHVLNVIEATVLVAGGAGGYTSPVKFNDASRYRGVYDDGSSYGASAKGTAV